MNMLKKLNPGLSDFQILYGIWFAGFGGMKRYLNTGYDPSDGNITLTGALNKAKNAEKN